MGSYKLFDGCVFWCNLVVVVAEEEVEEEEVEEEVHTSLFSEEEHCHNAAIVC